MRGYISTVAWLLRLHIGSEGGRKICRCSQNHEVPVNAQIELQFGVISAGSGGLY
jgi:hypothetical protein